MHEGGTETLAVGSSVGSSGGRGGERHSTGLMCDRGQPGSAGVSRGQSGSAGSRREGFIRSGPHCVSIKNKGSCPRTRVWDSFFSSSFMASAVSSGGHVDMAGGGGLIRAPRCCRCATARPATPTSALFVFMALRFEKIASISSFCPKPHWGSG